MDVFISYEHQSKSIADNICAVLESKGIRCWYAPRDVYGDYATSIVEAIESCKVFVLILNCDSSNSPHVLNEVEIAYQRILKGEIAIVPFKVDAGLLSKAMEYYVKRLHWIDAVSAPLEKAISQLYEQLMPILGIKEQPAAPSAEAQPVNTDRKGVTYYSPDDFVEMQRLQLEDELLFEYEKPLYDKLMFDKEGLDVLDLSVLNPRSTIRRFNRAEVKNVVALSYSDGVIAEGNDLSSEMEGIDFYKFNPAQDSVYDDLPPIMHKAGVEQFDLINLTMAFLDLKNPFKTLNRLKKFLRPGGMMFVRDVDDGVVFAYPDRDKLFEQFKEFYKYDTLSGSRNSARQVFNVMKKLGAKQVKLERCGINTASMDYDHKRLLFKSWFSFIPNDFRQILKEQPNNEKAKEVMNWVDEYYDDLEEEFFGDDFLFNSGYFIYTVLF